MNVTATRVTQDQARQHFMRGGKVLVSERGHELATVVTSDTTTHSRDTIDWDYLVHTVRAWSSRYPNQRFYVIPTESYEFVSSREADPATFGVFVTLSANGPGTVTTHSAAGSGVLSAHRQAAANALGVSYGKVVRTAGATSRNLAGVLCYTATWSA